MGLKSGSKAGRGSKQGSTKANIAKNQQQTTSKSTDSDDEPDVDSSILRPSIEISVSGVPQLVQAYEAATDGLRSLLASECDIIYECRVCRNLFRSVANMISHKKIYCKTNYSYTQHTLNRNHMVEDYTVLIQPEPVPSSSQENENWATSDKISDSATQEEISENHIIKTAPRISAFPKKGLNEIVDKLIRNSNKMDKRVTTCVSSSKLYENVNASILARKTGRSEHSFHLEDMETTKVGKYQTKLNASTSDEMEKEDLMKAQVSELQNMASESEAVLGPDGQIVRINGHPDNSTLPGQGLSTGCTSSTTSESDGNKNTIDEHVCPDCNVKFSTRKTLNHHMKSLHVTFRLCYPCPCCKSTFWNPWSVYRHLYKVHRKTNAQVRRLRPQIQKKAFRKEIKAGKPFSADVAEKNETLKESQRIDLENKAWMDNFEEDLELQRCGGCGRRFERRAALNSHSQICQKRIAARNSIKTAKNVPSTSSTDKVPKPVQSDCEIVEGDVNMRLSSTVRSTAGSNNSSLNPPAMTRNRQSSASNWSEQSKKEMPEKKIGIQIRKDYCKMSSASSVVALSNDTQSELDSRPPSRIGEDAESFDDAMRDWDSVIEMEEVRKEESEAEYATFGGVVASQCDVGNEESESSDLEIANSSKRCDSRVQTDSDKNSYFFHSPQNRKRSVSCDHDDCIYEEDIKQKKLRNEENESNDSIAEETANALSSKCRKLEQFHPIMEARMQELINLRRLQCLPCQKKFIKLTNLRRHVAVHIGWFRYKCILCTFKCFAKYDCVDHVCRTHLKGSQRAKATTLVRYIDEQEALTTESHEHFTSFSSIVDSDDSPNDALIPAPVKLDSLNIEDIKDIVGVTNKAIEIKEREMSKITEVPATTGNSCQLPEEKTADEEKPGDIKMKNFVEVDSINIPEVEQVMEIEVHETVVEEKSDKEVDREETLGAEETVEALSEEHFQEKVHTTEQSDQSKVADKTHIPMLKQERVSPLLEFSDGEKSMSEISEQLENELLDGCSPLKITEISEHLGENEEKRDFMALELSDRQTADETSLSQVKQGNMSLTVTEGDNIKDVDKNLNVLARVASDLTRDNQETIVASFSASEETIQSEDIIHESLTDIYPYSNPSLMAFGETSDFSRGMQKTGEITIPVKSEVLTEDELQKKTLQHILSVPIKTEVEEEFQRDEEEEDAFMESSVVDKDDTSTVVIKTEIQDSSSTEEPNELPNLDEKQIALRKMVMEVIFGSGSNENSHSDTNQNLFSAPMNGNLFDSDSSDGRCSRASSTSDVDSVMYTATNDHVSPVTLAQESTVPKLDAEHLNSMETERRERPVRNRVKATKEDFIYDFSDTFLKKEDSNRIINKKKHSEYAKDTVKHEHNSSVVKCVPKLIVLRTEGSELGGNKRTLTSGAKGSWSSTYSHELDCSSSKNSLVPNVKICSTSKKSARMYEVKP